MKKKATGAFLQKPLSATFSVIDSEPLSNSATGEQSYNAINESSTNDGINANKSGSIERHLSLFDLVNIGVGGTIGSGIFVLCGVVANKYAGPATCICWIISGFAACLSGVCYAELACRLPAAGSSYVYVYASMGELPAVCVAACLTLEYVVSGAAVARSWGDKMVRWLSEDLHMHQFDEGTQFNILDPGYNFNPLAALISAASVLLLMNGVKESTRVTNFITMIKVSLVAFMALVGMSLMKPQNLTPFIPPAFGYAGIFRGATSCFFGYIGFDELACLSHEAKNPQKNMPLSIVYTLGIVATLYFFAALALTGMQPYENISNVSGFPVAFRSNNWDWAAQISAFGEVFTLPITVLISVMAQPRLQYALAKDGLLPSVFAKVDESGNLWHGIVISGILMTTIAAFVPFNSLNDSISAGILLAFTMTDASLILMRYDSPDSNEDLLERSLSWFNLASFGFSVAITHFFTNTIGKAIAFISLWKLFACVAEIRYKCTPVEFFGGKHRKGSKDMAMTGNDYFKTPLMPYVPLFGMFINWYLIAQLELIGLCILLGFLGMITIFYFSYCQKHSIGNNGGWQEDHINDHVYSNEESLLN